MSVNPEMSLASNKLYLKKEFQVRLPWEPHQPKVVKSRYGTWYLDPKPRKKQNMGKPLMDPKETGSGVHNVTPPPIKKAAALSSPQKPGEDLAAVPREELNHVPSGGVSGKPLEMEQLLPKQDVTDSREHPADGHSSQAGKLRPQTGQASDGWCVMNLAGASDDVCKDKSKEQLGQPADSMGHEEWEVVSEHLAWGEAGKDGSVEDPDSKEWEQGDCPDGDLKAKRVAAVPPMFQNIHVTFRIHYITHSDAQLIGVTGDHECLGQWHSYVPLKYDKDGFWSESISLPVDTKVEWKFILVENGKVSRWEECGNRTLVTEHEDKIVHRWWGHH
ncbi:starch-binding domain-containing protein 1 [Limosa lapponica baueri]|uniref:Starch-binding domain-containing protein 1 n=1 Tax=Limosa lapponica baueri TaxID=1758121 RepID=A0A2I0TXY0_LIMLA|nr:starch-binding domain-containing protein 1 [Limosa lapponica baueri]